jgi:Rieske 2Fe-2S family protein
VRAFFNTCRHRGAVICREERGRAASLVCPYHNWTYDLGGALRHAGKMGADFNPAEFPLRPLRVEILEGTIYVCMAETPPDFAPFRAAVGPALAPHKLANAKLVLEQNVVARGNWKLVMENSRECYHCPSRHRSLMRSFLSDESNDSEEQLRFVAEYHARCEAIGLSCARHNGPDFHVWRLPFIDGAVSITDDGKPAVGKLLSDTAHGDIGSLRWVSYPTTFNHALGDYAFLVRMLPIGPQETLMTGKWLVNADAQEGRDYDPERLKHVWWVTNEEDKELIERNQAGVNSFGYRPGPYAPELERGVLKFANWYCATMTDQLAGPRQARRIAAE